MLPKQRNTSGLPVAHQESCVADYKGQQILVPIVAASSVGSYVQTKTCQRGHCWQAKITYVDEDSNHSIDLAPLYESARAFKGGLCPCVIDRGSNMSAHVLLNLLNNLGKKR